MVPNTSELLPEPETPVNTVSRRFGISTLTSLRLLTRAPTTRITSWRSGASASRVPGVFVALAIRSALLLDSDHVPGGVAHGTVTQAVRLLHGLLHDVGVGGH